MLINAYKCIQALLNAETRIKCIGSRAYVTRFKIVIHTFIFPFVFLDGNQFFFLLLIFSFSLTYYSYLLSNLPAA